MLLYILSNVYLSFPFGDADETYYRLYLPGDDQPHGYMLPAVVEKMPWTSDFSVNNGSPRSVTVLDSSNGADTATVVNAAFARIVSECIDRDLFHVLCRRHSEPFAIVSSTLSSPVYIERFAAQLFGITHRGVHLIGYTKSKDGMLIWVAQRSAHLYTYPNKLDATVGGGVQSGVSPLETLVEEANEEALLPSELIRQGAVCRGVISHMSITGKGFPGEQGLVIPDYNYVYDIELPADVVPRPNDDEVKEFSGMSVPGVQMALLRQQFKSDSAAVMIEFLIRHGFITPENEREFVEINTRLHRLLPFRTGGII